MPRGRHRHSPPLHRLLPPSAIAGVSLVCALGPWVFTAPGVLRTLAAAGAATALVGAAVMRRWDIQAGKQVADLTRARASDEWRFEERVAELEADLEESRELRAKLEQRLRAKRAELAGLRNEHAALLRRYATAETERASVLEERRVLEIEATTPARALTAGGQPAEAQPADARPAGAPTAAGDGGTAPESGSEPEAGQDGPAVPSVFSPEGSRLFLRAMAALARFDGGAPDPDGDVPADDGPEPTPKGGKAEPAPEREDEPQGPLEAVAGQEHATAASSTSDRSEQPEQPEPSAQQPSGHFTVPTAVAVVPQSAPVRRPVNEGGFDFFGTKKGTSRAALEAVQNEDLADVVGQEALALHKAETEARFKPAGPQSRAVGQVIDLTAHDETEQIDVQGLRSAAS
ncbi:hypothetical protein AB0K80_12125 [Streptomyces sp. NPDC052682]|uniref:hypothetical protein n=1 Tax=Streptomyces sp. NPDC052682 TaxID=3154954 RepID=UPI0034122E15